MERLICDSAGVPREGYSCIPRNEDWQCAPRVTADSGRVFYNSVCVLLFLLIYVVHTDNQTTAAATGLYYIVVAQVQRV